jgi:hypothetical protein
MKYKSKISIITIILVIIGSYYNKLSAQNIDDFSFLDKFAVLAIGDVEDNNPYSSHGSYGVNNGISGTHYVTDSILRNNDFPLLNSYSFLTKCIDKYNSIPSQITLSSLPKGTTLNQGNYIINSTTLLSGELNFTTSDTNKYFVININGDLIVDNSIDINLGNVLPNKVIWNISGSVYLNDSSEFYGVIFSSDKIILGNDVNGKVSLLSKTNIKLGRSNCLYSISEMASYRSHKISAMYGGSFAFVCSDGRVQVWGNNYFGQLANGSYGGIVNNPILVPGLTDVVSVEVGQTHVLALKKMEQFGLGVIMIMVN